MKQMLVSMLTLTVMMYVGFSAYLFANQRSYIYFPTPPALQKGEDSFILPSGDEKIWVWRVNAGKKRALIYFGGNAESVEYNLSSYGVAFSDHTLYFPHYRGYGNSTGNPTEAGLYQDALALYDAILPFHSDVTVLGRSLGSGVATYLAAERPIQRLALVTPFDSIEAIARRVYPLFPVQLLLQDKFDSLGRVPRIQCPTLVMVAEKDITIPHDSSLSLAQAFPEEQVTLTWIRGADHNTIETAPDYFSQLVGFLEDSSIGANLGTSVPSTMTDSVNIANGRTQRDASP